MNFERILSKVEEWRNSSQGQAKIKQLLDENAKAGKPLSNGRYVFSDSRMRHMSDALVRMIRRRLPTSIADVGDTLSYSAPVEIEPGVYQVVLSFDADTIHRDSLDNDLGYEGIDNIVALFNNGYRAENRVYGWWNNHKPTTSDVSYRSGYGATEAWVPSKQERPALHFMQDAIREFEALYGKRYGVEIILGAEYTK